MKRFFVLKKLMALILCFVMVCGYISIVAKPDSVSCRQVTSLYDVNVVKPAYITQGLSLAEDYPGGMLVFPIVNAELQMNDFYAIEIYRLGGTVGETTVTIESIDYTAQYGIDYEIYLSPIESEQPVSGEAAPIYAIQEISYIPTLNNAGMETADASGSSNSASKLYNEYINQFQDLVKPSSSFNITFANGENSKMIYIKTIQDNTVTDDLEFTLTMKSSSGTATIGSQSTMGFSITENRQKPDAVLEILDSTVSSYAENGYIIVKRTGNTGKKCSYRVVTKSNTAIADEDYKAVHLELDFLPGMTEHKIPFEVLPGAESGKQFTVALENVSNAVVLNDKATVIFDNLSSENVATNNVVNLGLYNPPLMNVRDKEYIPASEFVESVSTSRGVGSQKKSYTVEDKYAILKYSNKASSKNNAIAAVTKDKINFSGVKSITWYIDNYTGSCSWDHNAIYVSDDAKFSSTTGDYDFIHNFESEGIGGCWNMTNVSESYINRTTVDLDQSEVGGAHYLYMMLHKGACAGTAEFKIYSEGESSQYNITLNLIKYNLKVIQPESVGIFDAASNTLKNVIPTSNVQLIHPQTAKEGETIDIYRNENIIIKSTFISEFDENKPKLTGVKFCSEDGQQQSKVYSVDSNGMLKFTPSVIQEIQSYIFEDNAIYVMPVYNFAPVQLSVMEYTPSFENSNGQTFKLNADGFSGSLYVKDEKIGTVSWSKTGRENDKYIVGDTVKFVFTPESKYSYKSFDLDIKYFSGNTEASVNAQGGNILGGLAGATTVTLPVTAAITKIYPIITELDLGVVLHVINPNDGDYLGKNGDKEKENADGSVTVSGYKTTDNRVIDFSAFNVGEILSVSAKPKDDYRAKWSYIDTFTGKEHIYYGDSFFFVIQGVVNNNANVVTLEFEKLTKAPKEFTFGGKVNIQRHTILNPADINMDIYDSLKNASVFIGKYNTMSDENGNFNFASQDSDSNIKQDKFYFIGDEIVRALVSKNNQYFVVDINIADVAQYSESVNSVNANLKLKYSQSGPFPNKITATNKSGIEQPQVIVLAKGELIKFGLELNLFLEDENKPVNAVKWFLVDKDDVASEPIEETSLLNNAWYTEYSGVMSEIAKHGQTLWVELCNKTSDENGNEIYTSFGKFNTGYFFQAASVEEAVVYSPDIGVPSNITHPAPSIGPVNPTVSFYGLQPVFNVGYVGEDEHGNAIKTITIGISLSAMNDFMKEDKSFGTMTPLDKAKKLGEILGNYDECYNSTGKFPSFAGGEGLTNALKMNTAVNFSPSVALCFQSNYYIDSETSEWKFISTVYVMGFGGKLAVNIPFVFFYIPCFTNIAVELNLDICLCVMPNTVDQTTGEVIPLDINNLWDPNMSEMVGNYKIGGSLTFGLGIGFNGVVSASGNLKTALNLEFNGFKTGKGSLSMTGGVTVEFLFLKYSWSGNLFSVELFNSVDPQTATVRAMRSAMERDIMNSVTLKEMVLETHVEETELNVAKLRNAVLKNEHIISESPAMINPSVIEVNDGVYLATMVIGVDDKDTGKKIHKLYYFIYDENTDKVTDYGFVIDKYLSDLAKKGLRTSIFDNLDSDVQMIDCGEDILIAWTKLGNRLTKDADNLDLIKNIGIATLYYNKKTGEFHDYSMTSSDNEKEVYIRPKIVYDAKSNLAQLFYEKMNVSSLSLDSTLKELQELPTILCMRYNVLDGNSFRWFDESEIAVSENALQYFDVSNISGRNVLSYVGGKNKSFVLEDASEYEIDKDFVDIEEFNTKNSLYIQQFYLEEGNVVSGKQIRITDNESVSANPRFAKVRYEDKENLLLFFKHNGEYAYQNINNIISQGLYKDVNGDYILHEDYMEPTYIEADEELSVNDDLMIISDNNTIYALWTTTEGEQQQIMARSLSIVDIEEITEVPKRNADGSAIYDKDNNIVTEPLENSMYILKGDWGGRTYLTEGGLNNSESGKFKKDFDAVVTKSGDLLVVFNAYDVDYSEEGIGIKNNNVVVSLYDTASKYVINNSVEELSFSNNYPTEGETVKVQSLITNTGVLSGKNVKVTLYANGEKYSENIYKQWLTAETKTVEFYYTAPHGVKAEDIKLKIVVSEEEEIKCSSGEYSFKTGDALEIQDVMMIPVKQIGAGNDSTAYKVVAKVKNMGNKEYSSGKYLRIMDTDWKNLMSAMQADDKTVDPVVHTSYGQTQIDVDIAPGEVKEITYITQDIPSTVFKKNAGGTAAYLEHYIIESSETENNEITANEEMSYVSVYYNGLTTADYIRSVKEIKIKDISLKLGGSKMLECEITPKAAQSTAELSFKSSDESIAVVDSLGVVTAKGTGKCTVTVTSSNGISAVVEITVAGDTETGDDNNLVIIAAVCMVLFASVICTVRRKYNEINNQL